MAIAKRVNGNSSQQIEIPFAVDVIDVNTGAVRIKQIGSLVGGEKIFLLEHLNVSPFHLSGVNFFHGCSSLL